MYWQEQVPHYLLFCCVANVLQISDKQAHNKGIRNENPINAKSVQLIELHAFAYCLLCVYLSALLHLLEICVLDCVVALCVATSLLLCASTCLSVSARLCTTLIHLGRSGLHYVVEVGDGCVDGCNVCCLVSVLELR